MKIDMISDKMELVFILALRLVQANLALVLGHAIVGLTIPSLGVMRSLQVLVKLPRNGKFLRANTAASLLFR
jgi:hypothetical protein